MTLVPVNAGERQRFVDDLLGYMSPLEKAGQLVLLPRAPDPGLTRELHADGGFFDQLRAGLVGAVGGIGNRAQADALQRIAIEESRLGIPLLFAAETGSGFETVMPAPAAAAASWDLEAIEAAERTVSGEARARGINWALAPNIHLVGDSSHLEYAHSTGANTYLASQIGAARVRGLQHETADVDGGLIACLSVAESSARRHKAHSSSARIALEAVREAQVGSVAIDTASPSHSGERILPHPALDFLRRPGGYSGILLSDWAEFAAIAGQGPLSGGIYALSPQRLVQAMREDRIDAVRVDEAVRRVLAAKFDLGLFRSPFRHVPPQTLTSVPRPREAREVALDLARKSIVLLRNDPLLLPLGAESRDVLVVGATASDRDLPLGGQAGSSPDTAASVIDGLEQLGVPFKYAPGLALRHDGRVGHTLIEADRMAIGMACEAARRARTVIVVLGESMQGARYNALGEAQRQLLAAIHAVNERIVLVTMGARPLNPAISGEPLACVLHAGQLGTMSGHAIASVLTGEYAPTGRLPAPVEARDGARSLPFGFGLGYGNFTFAKFALEAGAGRIHAALELRNAGELSGTETIQLYIRRCDGPNAMDGGALRGFTRVTLRPGERAKIGFEVGAGEIGRYDDQGRFAIDAGRYEIQLGPHRSQLYGAEIDVPANLAAAMRGVIAGPGLSRRARGGLRSA